MRRTLFFVIRGSALINAALILFTLGVFVGIRYHTKEVLVNTTSAVSGRVVVIDPGHGGPDPGAVSASGTREKDIVLSIARKLQPLLNRAAVYTVLTRQNDQDLGETGTRSFSLRKRQDLASRVELANQANADIFVSIHANSFPESIWSGAQTFYYPGQEDSKHLAEAIQAELRARLGPNRRLARPGQYWVLEKTTMPAVVVEVGFLSNPEEARLLADEEYQERVAEAVFYGIVRYFTEREKAKREKPLNGEVVSKEAAVPAAGISLMPGEAALFFQAPASEGLAIEKRRIGTGKESVEELSKAALEALINGPVRGSGLRPIIPEAVRLLEYRVSDGTAYVDLSQEMHENFRGGGKREELTVYSIVNTLTAFPGIEEVWISIAGDAVTSIGGHLVLEGPLTHNKDIVSSDSSIGK